MKYSGIDIGILLDYFENLSETIHRIFPTDLPMEEIVENHFVDLSFYKHPKWVKEFFPLIMIYHREKAGKLRKGSSPEIIYQNHNNVITQLVCTADDYGICHRKNKSKGFHNIVAAIKVPRSQIIGLYGDRQKPTKYTNFEEFARCWDPADKKLKNICELLQVNYPCDARRQEKLF